jgi:hypothetical protein
MNKKIHSIVKEAINKFGIKDYISISAAFIAKNSNINDEVIDNVLNQELEININELESLFVPNKFEFEKHKIDKIEVKNEV